MYGAFILRPGCTMRDVLPLPIGERVGVRGSRTLAFVTPLLGNNAKIGL